MHVAYMYAGTQEHTYGSIKRNPKSPQTEILGTSSPYRRLSLQLSYLAFRELYTRDEKRYKIVSK